MLRGFFGVILILLVFGTVSNSFGAGNGKNATNKAQNRIQKEIREERKERREEALTKPSAPPIVATQSPFETKGEFKPKNKIDVLLAESLQKRGIKPTPRCSDEVFLRRVYLDVIGTLPTMEDVREFLADKDPEKRSKLIDRLMARTEFVDYWSMKWSDVLRVKAEFPVNLWPNGAMIYYRWIHEAIRTNKPYDQFARELLLSDGSNFRDGAVNFYRAVSQKDAETLSETVAQTFLGARIGPWPEQKRKDIAVFFSRIGYKATAQWKEEFVYWDRKPLDSPDVVFPDGTKGTVKPNQDPRQVFTDWLISPNNVGFNRNIANRIWFWLFGAGLVHEPDDFRDDNPPVHPELLDYLCKELVDSKYDLRRLYKLILNSNAYQQSSIPNKKAIQGEAELFASYPIRRLEAEVLQDALSQIFDVPIGYQSEVPEPFTFIPPRFRSIMLPDASVTSSFLEMFGRASRDTGLESDRNNGVTESQQLFLLNSTEVNLWSMKFVGKFRNTGRRPEDRLKVVDEIWLTILSRYPTQVELRAVATDNQDKDRSPGNRVQDLVWALLNTKEFLCKH